MNRWEIDDWAADRRGHGMFRRLSGQISGWLDTDNGGGCPADFRIVQRVKVVDLSCSRIFGKLSFLY